MAGTAIRSLIAAAIIIGLGWMLVSCVQERRNERNAELAARAVTEVPPKMATDWQTFVTKSTLRYVKAEPPFLRIGPGYFDDYLFGKADNFVVRCNSFDIEIAEVGSEAGISIIGPLSKLRSEQPKGLNALSPAADLLDEIKCRAATDAFREIVSSESFQPAQ